MRLKVGFWLKFLSLFKKKNKIKYKIISQGETRKPINEKC